MSKEILFANQVDIDQNVCTKKSTKNSQIYKPNSAYFEGGEIEIKTVTKIKKPKFEFTPES